MKRKQKTITPPLVVCPACKLSQPRDHLKCDDCGCDIPTKIPQGPNMMNLTCGHCGHQADFDDFQRKGFPASEFHCPKCKHTWQVQSGNVEKIIQTPGGGIAIRSKFIEPVKRPLIMVPYDRMKDSIWYPKDGDIRAALVNTSGKLTIRKTFDHDAKKWVNWGGSEISVVCTPLVPWTRDAIVPGTTRQYCHENQIVTLRGQQYLCGPEVEFVAAPRGLAAEAEHARRLYAFGGLFASEPGSYNALLRKWITESDPTPRQIIVWKTEMAADLPQTQEGMRELLGESRPGVPRSEPTRFNPLTGKTN